MDNKKIAVIVVAFIVIFIGLVGILAIVSHIPILRKPLGFILAIIMVAFVVGFFALIARRKRQ